MRPAPMLMLTSDARMRTTLACSYQVVENHKSRLTVDNQILLKKLDRKERRERTLLEQLQTKERKIQVRTGAG